MLADVFQPAERGPQVIELVQETLRGYHQRTDVLVVVQQAAVFPQQPLVSAGIDAVPLVEIFQQVLLLLLVHKSQADIQAVCQRGEYVQETEGRIVLPFVTVGEIDVGYEQHDMAAQHADIHGKRGLLLRVFHLGENIRRGFLDGIDQLPEFQIVVFQIRMARADAGNDLIAPENRFKQQVTAVMDCTQKQNLKLLEKEIRKLLDIAGELKDANIRISALFIASEACYAIREYKSSMRYSDKTIREAEKVMKDGEAAGYSYWKMAVSMKAAILTAEKKREEAVALYEEIAGKAVERKDPYYVMEGYRMCGFLRYEEGKLEQAFEYFLLALAGGSYLSEDIRRGSTFTYAAHLALHTGRQVRAPIDIEVLEHQLHEWLGEDWKELVENPSMRQAKARRKGGIFN